MAVAAYAAASMAGADPFRTGNTAFRLALAKALVPFVFVFSPSLLIMVPDFTWTEFALAFAGCLVSVTFLGAALSAYLLAPMPLWERLWLTVAALPAMATGWCATGCWHCARAPVIRLPTGAISERAQYGFG